jgi:hypothetical protein
VQILFPRGGRNRSRNANRAGLFSRPCWTGNQSALVDLNGDSKLDLLDGVEVAYGNGDGTFAQATPVSFLSSGFQTSYGADLNGDGKTDVRNGILNLTMVRFSRHSCA